MIVARVKICRKCHIKDICLYISNSLKMKSKLKEFEYPKAYRKREEFLPALP